MNNNRSYFSFFICILILVECSGLSGIGSLQEKNPQNASRLSIDTLKPPVDLTVLRDEAIRVLKSNEISEPIWIYSTQYYLLTHGQWHSNTESVLYQGKMTSEDNPYYPNPVKRSLIKYFGDLKNLTIYNATKKNFVTLLDRDQEIKAFWMITPENASPDENILVMELHNPQKRFIVLNFEGTEKLDLHYENRRAIDWYFNKGQNVITVLYEPSSSDEPLRMTLHGYPIETFSLDAFSGRKGETIKTQRIK